MESNLIPQGQALVAWLVSVTGRVPQLSDTCVNVCTGFCTHVVHADLCVLQLASFRAHVMDVIPYSFISTGLRYNLMAL